MCKGKLILYSDLYLALLALFFQSYYDTVMSIGIIIK